VFCLELFAVPGTRRRQDKLRQELGSSLAELEAAAKEDRVRKVKGLGASVQTKILKNVSIAHSGETQLLLHKATALLEHAVETLKQQKTGYYRIEIANAVLWSKLMRPLAARPRLAMASEGTGLRLPLQHQSRRLPSGS
jgi:hypothetical protein